ncbi:MAG: glycosyltransferase [Cyclobacteriaceae bacterium]|nr:glycosyltransferase [Cyclobacteriaceae bacterium]
MIHEIFNQAIFVYAITICGVFLLLLAIALIEMNSYMKKNFFVDYKYILSSPFAPSVSLVAPAYNEGMTIIDNVKSLLSLSYNNNEIIIVNDGSKDDTMAKLIEAFDLVPVPYAWEPVLETAAVRKIYKSRNRAFRKLLVVDKENGGKADALNAGLNLSQKELVACIDVDCIIESDALLKMVKPFMEDHTVIGSGGVVRIANSCVIEEGRLVEVRLPEKLLPRFQVLEYIRAFLLGRLAWSRLNGLLLISGAFGMFKREVALSAGGYNPNTVGEDMELVVRMRRTMREQKKPYRVAYIPDPLCWTEAPSTNQVLGRQRNRWTRGMAETLWTHRALLFNPKYGRMGLISYPYWLFYEWLSPIMEFLGLTYLLFRALTGGVNWDYFFTLVLVIYSFSFFVSMIALLAEQLSFYRYTKRKDTLKMIFLALIEPVWYHPRLVWWSLRGNFDLIRGKRHWGNMVRQGFRKHMEEKMQPEGAMP